MEINDVINELLVLSLDEKYAILNSYLDLDGTRCDCDDCVAERANPDYQYEYEPIVDADLVSVYSEMFRYVVFIRR